MPDRPATYDDIIGLDAPDVTEEIPQSPRGSTEDAPEVSFGEWFSAVARRDFTPYGIARFAADAGIPWDEGFDFEAQVPAAEWQELAAGLPEDVQNNIADRARSRAHLYYLADIARESLAFEETINAPGAVAGTLGRIAAGIADPGNVALAVTTGGAGLVGRAERLQRAIGRASTLAERRALVAELGETVARTGVARQAASRAAAAGAESAALSAVVNAGDPTKDEWDTVYGAVGGIALGGIIGGTLSAREATRLRRMLSVETRRLENAEAADAVAKQRGALVESLGDVEAARGRVAVSQQDAAIFLAERDSGLSDYAQFRRALESGGRTDAANPNSSAVGADQFIESTWLRTVEQTKPAWAKGLSREQLLELRKDPAKSAEMAQALDKQNASILRKADAPVNPFTLYALHHFGSDQGKRFALASPEAKAADMFPPNVLEANPYLKGKTKAQIVAHWTQRARQHGIDLDGMIDRAPASPAEAARVAALESLDREGTATRITKLDAEVRTHRQHRAKLEKEAAEDILPESTERALKDELGGIGRTLKAADAPTGPARAALLQRQATITPQLHSHKRAAAAKETLRVLLADDPEPRITAQAQQLREALGLAEGLQRQVDADATRRGQLRASRRAVKDTESQLDQLDALDNLGTNLEARQRELDARGNAAPVGRETLSAARVSGFDPGLYPSLEDRAGEFAGIGQMKFGGATGLYGWGTFSGVLRGSDNETVRNLLGPMVSNVLGNVDGSAVSAGADEIASGTARAMKGRFDAAVFNPYREWLRAQGLSRLRAFDRGVRHRFMREVGNAIRDPNSGASDQAKQAASQVRGIFADILKQAKEAGVPGFENVTENAEWLPRVFDFHAVHGLNQRFGPEQMEALINGAIQSAAPELEEKVAARVASAYFKRMRELRMGNDAGLMQGMRLDNVPFMRRFLEDAGLPPDEVSGMLDQFRQLSLTNGPKGGGDFRHAKRRLQLDEAFSMKLRRKGTISDTPENFEEVAVSDLFDSNVENLFGRYSRTMAGHIGLAKVGIKGRADFEERMRIVARELEGDPKQWENVKGRAEAAYDLLTARPLTDASLWTELARTARDLAFDTQMENAGLSNIPDMAALLAWGNFRHTADAFFRGEVFGSVWKRGRDGRLSDDLFREIEETFGLGTDFLNNQVFSAYDIGEEYAEEVVTGRRLPRAVARGFAKVGHGARVVGRGVSAGSGLAAVQTFTQRIAARNVIFRIKEEVFAGKGFSKARMAALGLDEATGKRIAEQMRKHTAWLKGDIGGRIQYVNFHAWDDIDARDAFMYAVLRETKKNAQESTLGDTFYFQHRTLGKLLSQFRSFGLAAYTKQLLRGISEGDAEAATRAALQFMLAAGVWKLRHEAVAAGMEIAGADPDKVEDYREKNLTPGRIAAAGIRNSGTFSLAPDVYDSSIGALTGAPLFDVRNSGLSSNAVDLFASMPALTFGKKLSDAVGGTTQAALRGDRQFTQRELRAWQSVLPFGHHLLVAPAFEAAAAELPKTDDDPDPDEFDWL